MSAEEEDFARAIVARGKKQNGKFVFESHLPIELDQSNSAFAHIGLLMGDEELLEAFIQESPLLLESSNSVIKQWQKEPRNDVHPKQLQRYLSILKNSAYLTSLFPIADLTGHTESLVSLVIDNKFEIEIATERYTAQASLKALYDPNGMKMRI